MTEVITTQPPKIIRIGVLGAARIVPIALLKPAGENTEVVVSAVAARDIQRAKKFASRYAIPTVHASYSELLANSEIDAIYNPLPNGLHGQWTIAALQAGKHVLCEKPFTANAQEAKAVAEVARPSGLVVMEAFHYRYHALIDRLLEIIASGELGEIRHIETWMCIPLLARNIRWNLELAGGAMMDVGCYAIHLLRTLAGAEPDVKSARARELKPGVDRFLHAEFGFKDGRTGAITASMLSRRLLAVGARVEGTEGSLRVSNPIMPQYKHRIVVRKTTGAKRKEKVAPYPSTYAAQLQAFADAVLRNQPFPTNIDDAVANMTVIDQCYAAAGMKPRQPTANFQQEKST